MTKRSTADSQASARERILDAAEAAFARDGFAGAGMKGIARQADVAQGLLHYHFEHKEGLYAAVIQRRSAIINAERETLLEKVDPTAPGAVPEIFRALLGPPLGHNGGGRAYARILAGMAAGEERDLTLVAEHYEGTMQLFVQALAQACPGASLPAVNWAYNLSISAMIALAIDDQRPPVMPDGGPDGQVGDGLERLVSFAEGGLRALIARG